MWSAVPGLSAMQASVKVLANNAVLAASGRRVEMLAKPLPLLRVGAGVIGGRLALLLASPAKGSA